MVNNNTLQYTAKQNTHHTKEMEEDKNESGQSVAQTEGRINIEQISEGDPKEELTVKEEILDKRDTQEVKESSVELQDSAGHEVPEPKKATSDSKLDQSNQKNHDKKHKTDQSESKTNKNVSLAEPIKSNKQESEEVNLKAYQLLFRQIPRLHILPTT